MPIDSMKFWDRIAPGYSQQTIADEQSYTRKLSQTQALMQPDMKVLEFGCGTGSTALLHAPYVAKIVATDISSAMIAIARQKARADSIDNVTFIQSGAEEFESQAGSFDMILALNLIHLLPDHNAFLSKAHRLLKPGGIFVSSTVCLADRLWFMRPVIPVMQWLGKAPFVQFLSALKVKRAITEAGFDVVESWAHGRANSLFLIARKA